jgi:hypothetical protein
MLDFVCVEHGYIYSKTLGIFIQSYVKCNSAKIQEKVSLNFEFPTETQLRILSKNE